MRFRLSPFVLAVCCFVVSSAFCQINIPLLGSHKVISGYLRETEGEIISYFSSCPNFATDALLTRCTDGKKNISLQTDVVSEQADNGFYYFYWLSGHSSGTSGADRAFDVMINGEKYLTFTTPAKKSPPFKWIFTGKDSVAVVFEATKKDIHNDVFGNMYLRVPEKLITKGKPLNLSITGHAEKSNDWFMVFRYAFTEKARCIPAPLLINTEKGIKQLLQVYLDHIDPTTKEIKISVNAIVQKVPIQTGFNYIEIPIDTVSKPTQLTISLQSGEAIFKQIKLMQQPVHFREVDIIHHSHNDIGYSHVQEHVMSIQQQNILDALDQIDKTAAYPQASRFKWNVECLWPIEYFMKHASDKDKKRFTEAVLHKDIALSGFYVGVMTGLCSAKELEWIMEYADYLKKTYHFPIQSAMFSDIPGMSWSITDAMVKSNLRYLSNGPNFSETLPDRGDRIGATIRDLGDKPFYWKTTDNKNKILVWTAGRGYNLFHQIPAENMADKIKEKLVAYLNELDSTHYPYDMVQLRYTIKSDNGPVDKNLSDFVRNWNATYYSPQLVISGVDDMMQRFEKKYGGVLPTYSGDFTPYWEDGAYSTAAEEGETRILSNHISQLEKIGEINKDKALDDKWFYEAHKNIIMFNEHTWGAWNSISSPDDEFTLSQWQYKKAFIDSAKKYIAKIESVLLPTNLNKTELVVYNTLAYVRSGYVETNLPINQKGNILIDEKGQPCFFQRFSNDNICFFAKDIPAKGHKTYHLAMSDSIPNYTKPLNTLNADPITGALNAFLYDGKQCVDTSTFSGLNQAIYIKGLNPDVQSFSHVNKVSVIEDGPIKRSLRIDCSLEGTNTISYYYTVFRDLNYVQLTTLIDKKPIRDKKSLHIAFPFNINYPVNRIGISDTFYIPSKGQIPGANHDFYSVQRWIDVSGSDYGVTLSSPQAALFEIGSLTDERPLNNSVKAWKPRATPSATLFLYALNNYWNTNFKADQSGQIRFDCYLQFHHQFDINKAKRFGEEMTNPPIVWWR